MARKTATQTKPTEDASEPVEAVQDAQEVQAEAPESAVGVAEEEAPAPVVTPRVPGDEQFREPRNPNEP